MRLVYFISSILIRIILIFTFSTSSIKYVMRMNTIVNVCVTYVIEILGSYMKRLIAYVHMILCNIIEYIYMYKMIRKIWESAG
jgi:hypothetical protein